MSKAPAPSRPRVAVIILTWNGRELTMDCLASLERVETPGVELIVVDNASSDDTVAAVRGRYGDAVTVIENEDNIGFARGNNVGIEYALQRGAEFVLLLNNDTVVDPGFLDALLAPLLDDDAVGITGPKIFFYTPKDQIWFAGGEVMLARGTARHIGIRERDVGQYDTPRDVDYVTGCALMARRAVFVAIGQLDPSYMAYYEDTDFCLRARAAGFRVRYAPEGRVWHKISASTGGQLSRRKVARKLRSTFRFLRRHAKPYHWLTIPFFFVADVVRIAGLVLGGRIRDGRHTGSHNEETTR
jgi:GT2 family glycosyltransferase